MTITSATATDITAFYKHFVGKLHDTRKDEEKTHVLPHAQPTSEVVTVEWFT